MSTDIYQDQEIIKAVRSLKFGSVEIIVHDSKVVQVERTEKIRYQSHAIQSQREINIKS